jgi:glycosyltransferase involved in cell wall biosynthesis
MKSVEILIPNYNVGPVIELNIESIRARTNYPNYSIIVHDDSTEGTDRVYLEKIEAKGWIRLIRSTTRERWEKDKENFIPSHPAPYWHGCALNVLINEACGADLVMILDGDVYIKDPSWLRRMVDFMGDKILVAAHWRPPSCFPSGACVPGWWMPHFCMLNMAAYRDGMAVDWRGGSALMDSEPYKTILAPLAARIVCFDPGSSLWIKMQTSNPRHYRGCIIPDDMQKYYHHFSHGSLRSLGEEENKLVMSTLTTLRKAI